MITQRIICDGCGREIQTTEAHLVLNQFGETRGWQPPINYWQEAYCRLECLRSSMLYGKRPYLDQLEQPKLAAMIELEGQLRELNKELEHQREIARIATAALQAAFAPKQR